MNNLTEEKWYDNSSLLDLLVFILPPIGLYGLYKTNKLRSVAANIMYSIIGLINLSGTLIFLFR